MEYQSAVFIGRFQPFHDSHLKVVERGLEIAENVIIMVGSATAAPSIKNPFSFEERKGMIWESLPLQPRLDRRIHIFAVRDYYYSENAWLSEVQAKTGKVIPEGASVALLGAYKDASSYYLKSFPQWTFEAAKTRDICATDLRTVLLRESYGQDWEGRVPEADRARLEAIAVRLPVPPAVRDYLQNWVTSARYVELAKEHAFLEKYKEQWASAPFPPTFVTTDAVVVCSGHVLVVKRRLNPGKGLYALPGGFLKQDQKIEDSMLRELKEETGIRVDKLILESSIVASRVFDHPHRSLRGRTITHAFYLKLKDGKLPEVRGGDDASEALWMPLWDVIQNEEKFYEDHGHIIQNLVLGAQGER